MNRRELLQASAALAASGGLRLPLPLIADEPKPLTPDEAIHKSLTAEVERITKGTPVGTETKAEWEARRPDRQRLFRDMLGLDPLPEKTPLKAAVTGKLERGGVVVEKVHFQSRPGLYVTGNFYRPKEAKGKLPAVLYLCGHSNNGRDGNKTAYQDHPRWFASNGYVCLVVDTLQLGEVAGVHHGTYNLGRWWWHSRGYTPAGVECWNAVRALDYLVTRPEVDPDRLGVTGRSGGGATTVWVAAVDDRVKVAVPVSGMSDLEDYVSGRVINGHCDCMFGYNLDRWEWSTVLALFAPKPLLFANDDADPIFPMAGNRRIVARLRKLYATLGQPDLIDEFVTPGKHDDSPAQKAAAFGFFHKHLKGDAGPVAVPKYEPIDGKLLRVFPEDADLPKDAINATVDEVFVPKAEVKLPADGRDFSAWKAGLMKPLKEKVFHSLPPAAEWKAEKGGDEPDLLGPPPTFWDLLARPKGGVEFPLYYLGKGRKARTTLVVLNPDDDHTQDALFRWAERFPGDTLVVIHTRGGGPNRWTRKNPPNTVERSLALLGQTADSGRVWDVTAALAFVDKHPVRVAGKGAAGVIAAYAALFARSADGKNLIDEVVLIDPPTSHRDGPHFLGVMRVLDIPDALGMLAPNARLTLTGQNANDPAFDRTAALYRLAGAEAKFKRG